MPRVVDVEQRLEVLRDAVVTIAAADGFGAVTMRRVAAEAGASTSLVTHYVASRDQLVRSTLEREVAVRKHGMEAAAAAEPAGRAVRALLEATVLGGDAQSRRLWLAVVLGAGADPVLREALTQFNTWWDASVRGLLDAAGVPPRSIDGTLDAVAVITDGLVIARFEADAPLSALRCRAVLDALLEPLLPSAPHA